MKTTFFLIAIASLAACGVDGPDENAGGGGSVPATTTASSSIASTGTGGQMDLPPSFTVTGRVLDDAMQPLADAIVLQGGKSHEPHFTTGADGAYTIEMTNDGHGIPGVVATKQGYRSRGFEFYQLPDGAVDLVLYEAHTPDNVAYEYGEPGMGADPSTKYCGHCHESFAADFQTSKHAQATKDPLVQDLYAGVSQAHPNAASCGAAGGIWRPGLVPGTASDAQPKCYLGGGVLPDLNTSCGGPVDLACDDPALPVASAPTSFGQCADCHAPAIDGVAGGRDLHEAIGVAFDNGVHCDLCHKVKDIDLTAEPGVAGRLVLQRPIDPGDQPQLAMWRPLVFGPLIDVPNAIMGASPQPKFKEATFCGGCHEQEQAALIPGQSLDPQRWPDGLPVHSTYDEWLAGPYAAADTPCQFCHMPADFDLVTADDHGTVDNASITFGYPRPAEDLRRHIFRSPLEGNPRLIDHAAFVHIDTLQTPGELTASVVVANIGCGHALPTGEPMRSMLLVVDAEGVGCTPAPDGGMTLNDVGGARAVGLEGQSASTAGAVVTWAEGAALAQPGDVVRVVRPSGVFDDYLGVGFFADPMLTPQEKGLEIHEPVGQAVIASVNGSQIVLAQALPIQPGDVIYLGDAVAMPVDGQLTKAIAGAPGWSFARVLVDAGGVRQAPHYRAIDMVSDNRIPPGESAVTSHRFAVAGCTSVTLRAWLVYRPLPLWLANERGWVAKDWVAGSTEVTVPVP
jgi:hypothetical protein